MITLLTAFVLYGSSVTLVESSSDKTLTIELLSERSDLEYNPNVYNDTNNFAYRRANITMCVQILDAIQSLKKVLQCNTVKFENVDPGIQATILLVIDNSDGEERFETFIKIRKAIVEAAKSDSNWLVGEDDITLRQPTAISSGTVNFIQVPLILCLLVILYYLK